MQEEYSRISGVEPELLNEALGLTESERQRKRETGVCRAIFRLEEGLVATIKPQYNEGTDPGLNSPNYWQVIISETVAGNEVLDSEKFESPGEAEDWAREQERRR